MDYYQDAPWHTLPPHMWEGLRSYVMEGIEPGGFLQSIVKGDPWNRVLERADGENQLAIMAWARFMYNWVPLGAWGTKARYKAWVEQRGMKGLRAKGPSPVITPLDGLGLMLEDN